jgi:hypothetical protein
MRSLGLFVAVVVMVAASAAKDESQVSDLVKQHLNSIGTEQARAAVKNRAVQGTLSFQVPNENTGRQDGKEVFVSEGDKLVSLLKLPNPSYHGERFVSDGKKTLIADVRPGVYSRLGQFVMVHNEILTEGLWGGTLSTGWAMGHLDERNAKLQDRGLKKVDGRELHRVDYSPKKHSDLEIQLYFEPDTFRHVMTVYLLTITPSMGHNEVATARQQETRYRLVERFSDFKSIEDLNLPELWSIQFTSEVPNGSMANSSCSGALTGPESCSLGGDSSTGAAGTTISTTGAGAGSSPISQYEVRVTSISNNVQLDPKNFEVR